MIQVTIAGTDNSPMSFKKAFETSQNIQERFNAVGVFESYCAEPKPAFTFRYSLRNNDPRNIMHFLSDLTERFKVDGDLTLINGRILFEEF